MLRVMFRGSLKGKTVRTGFHDRVYELEAREIRGLVLSSMKEDDMVKYVRDLMTPHPVTLSAASTLVDAAIAMRDFDVGAVIVLDLDHGQVCGIATDRDIVVRGIANGNYPATTKLGEICSRELTMVAPSDSIDEAMRLMRDKAIRRLPVVENGHPVGILSLGDLASEQESDSPLADISNAPPNR
jgi:CBS domain-containing protein